MESGDVLQLVILILLLILSGFFSSAETATTAVNQIRIKTLADDGNKKAILLLKITKDKGKLLSTILIGNNIVNITASSLATTVTIRLFGNEMVGFATGILTMIILLFGEITPKTLATIHAEKISLQYARILYLLMIILTPVIVFVNFLSRGVLLLLHVDVNQKAPPMTEDELLTIVDASHEGGVIESEERQMIYNVFDLDNSHAKDIMVPRVDMNFVAIDSTYSELVEIFQENGHTRYPVYEDTTDSIIGVINIKDLIGINPQENFSVRDIIREAFFTYEHKHISDLLEEMREKSISFMIVLDEYGATAGLLTMEDILEEIVGEIRDEYDEDELEMVTEILPNQEYIVLGSANLNDLSEELKITLVSEEYDSLGGYIIEQLDRLPDVGESFEASPGLTLCVDKITKNRIELVHVYMDRPLMEKAVDEEPANESFT